MNPLAQEIPGERRPESDSERVPSPAPRWLTAVWGVRVQRGRSQLDAAIRLCRVDRRLRNFIWRRTDDGRSARYAALMRTSGGDTIPEEAAVALGYYEVPCVACGLASTTRRREPQSLARMRPSDVCPSCLGSGRNWNRLGRIPLSDDGIVELCNKPAPEAPMTRR